MEAYYIPEDDLELLFLLTPFHECWDYSDDNPAWFMLCCGWNPGLCARSASSPSTEPHPQATPPFKELGKGSPQLVKMFWNRFATTIAYNTYESTRKDLTCLVCIPSFPTHILAFQDCFLGFERLKIWLAKRECNCVMWMAASTNLRHPWFFKPLQCVIALGARGNCN